MISVSPRPQTWHHAEDIHHECGPYQLRAVLNAFGKDAPIKELYASPRAARNDWSFPWNVPSILRRYGIETAWHFWRRGIFKARLIAALEANRPVLFVIHSFKPPGTGGWHWISAWGYDDTTDEFLCYDSQQPSREGDCIGNVHRGTSALLARLPWRGTFTVTTTSGPGRKP